MYNKVLNVILIILVIAILGVIGYIGYGYYKKHTINSEAIAYLEEFDTLVVQLNEQDNNVNEVVDGNSTQSNESGNGNNQTSSSNNNKPQMNGISTNSLYYKGFKVIGKLEMPTINIQYPILDVITHADAIEVSIGMLYGVGPNKYGNTVIIGHNYRNGLFFGRNKKLNIGDKIYITDLEGKKLEYTIYNKYTTPESDTSYITNGNKENIEVTLVTCDATGKNRLVVCARVEQ